MSVTEQIAIAVCDYTAQAERELSLIKGQRVLLLNKSEDGWRFVKLKDESIVGRIGWIPPGIHTIVQIHIRFNKIVVHRLIILNKPSKGVVEEVIPSSVQQIESNHSNESPTTQTETLESPPSSTSSTFKSFFRKGKDTKVNSKSRTITVHSRPPNLPPSPSSTIQEQKVVISFTLCEKILLREVFKSIRKWRVKSNSCSCYTYSKR
jgi:hypothetical protein